MTRTGYFLRYASSMLLALAVGLTVSPLVSATADDSYRQGWAAYDHGDYQRAAQLWLPLANSGHVNAQTNLGVMYEYGKGVAQSARQAANWYRAAAAQESVVAQYNLGLFYTEDTDNTLLQSRGMKLLYRAGMGYLSQKDPQGAQSALTALEQADRNDTHTIALTTALDRRFGKQKRVLPSAVELPVSTGTAWPIFKGYVVTNHHVVSGSKSITLINRLGVEIPAELVASDLTHDIALLSVSHPEQLPKALPLASTPARLGSRVFTIGFPRVDVMGKTPKLSLGIISSENGIRDDPRSYQISVPIQPGNSGGPLVNMDGEVVGLITSMLGSASDATRRPLPNINYALKIDVVKKLVRELPGSAMLNAQESAGGNLETLANSVQGSVLIVMAE